MVAVVGPGEDWGFRVAYNLDPAEVMCFDSLKGFDPNDPKGLNKPAAPAGGPVKPKKSKKKEENLEDLFDAGLNMGKKKKPGKK